jgi:hypothetical protein
MAASTSGLGTGITDSSLEAAAASRSRRRELVRCHLAASFTTLLNRYALRSSMPDHRRLLTQPRTAAETTSGASEGPTRPVANLVRSSACFRYSSSSPTTPIRSRNRAFWVTRSWCQTAISEPCPRTPAQCHIETMGDEEPQPLGLVSALPTGRVPGVAALAFLARVASRPRAMESGWGEPRTQASSPRFTGAGRCLPAHLLPVVQRPQVEVDQA